MAVTTVKTPSGSGPTYMTQDFSHIKLPLEKSKPSTNLADYLLFFFGQKKIGKTTFASQFPRALHLFFEPGGTGIEALGYAPASWKEFKYIISMLEPGGDYLDEYENVIIDTVDIAYKMCVEDYCASKGFEHLQDSNDFGKSYDLSRDEFANTMSRLRRTKLGILCISHAIEKDIKTRGQGTWTRVVPTLADRAVAWLSGAADINAYYGYYGSERRLVIDGSDHIEAGCRLKHNFRTTDGRRIKSIPMGDSDEEAFENFYAAFRNEQEEDGGEVHGEFPTLTADISAAVKARPVKAGK